jgi:hypothetical protein
LSAADVFFSEDDEKRMRDFTEKIRLTDPKIKEAYLAKVLDDLNGSPANHVQSTEELQAEAVARALFLDEVELALPPKPLAASISETRLEDHFSYGPEAPIDPTFGRENEEKGDGND